MIGRVLTLMLATAVVSGCVEVMTDERADFGRKPGVTCTADRPAWNQLQTQGLVSASRREHGSAVLHLTAARDRIGREAACDQARARIQYALGQSLIALNQPRAAVEPFKDALAVEQERIDVLGRPQRPRSAGAQDDPDDNSPRPTAAAPAAPAAPRLAAPGATPPPGGITAVLLERLDALTQAQEDAGELADAEITARRWITAANQFFTGRPVSRAGDAYTVLGEVLFKRERYQEAEAALKRALEIQEPQPNAQPLLSRTRGVYADVLDATGRSDEARALRQRAVQAAPRR
ncbi:MAG: tetratricopeptide repeat protein [Alphaproteobacteria bacterium]|nr:tetratricopeptide repeat protein [Alphaproteobacteria bacterium]